jgi:hypothetical protein
VGWPGACTARITPRVAHSGDQRREHPPGPRFGNRRAKRQINLHLLNSYEVIMAVKSGEVAVNLGNSRVQFPPSLSNRWELIGTLPAFILSNRTKNPTQIGSLSNHRKSRSVTFSTIFDRSQHPPPYAVF